MDAIDKFKLALPRIRREIEVYELYTARFQNVKHMVKAHHFYQIAKEQFERELNSVRNYLRDNLKGHLNHLDDTYNDFSKLLMDEIIDLDSVTREEIEGLLKEIDVLINISKNHLALLKL
ncbi:MAG: hypothetical protein HZA00_08460 [Nitrospinae bacterium]|nr:hypothetical protein [Nitrospinota bacterium]